MSELEVVTLSFYLAQHGGDSNGTTWETGIPRRDTS